MLAINKSKRCLKHFVDVIHKSNAAKCFRRSTSVETRFVVQWKSSPSLKQSVNASNVLPWRGRVPWRRGRGRRRTRRLSQIKVECCSPRERVAHSLFLGGGPPQNCTAQHSILSHPTNGSECSGRLIQFRSDRRGYSHKHFQERIPTPRAAAAGRGRARANARTRFHASYAPNDAAAARRTTAASLTPPVRRVAGGGGGASRFSSSMPSFPLRLSALPVCRRRLNKRASAGCWFSGSNTSSSVIGAPIFDESFSEAIDLIVN